MTKFWLRLWGGFVITLVIFILQTDYILGFGYVAAVFCWLILWVLFYFVLGIFIKDKKK